MLLERGHVFFILPVMFRDSKMIFLVLAVSSCLVALSAENSSSVFTVGVYEHVLRGRFENISLVQMIHKNLGVFDGVCQQAADEKVDVLVFPEYGIAHGSQVLHEARQVLPFVPDPNVKRSNPCTENTEFQENFILRNLSCMALKYKLILIANIITKYPCDNGTESSCPPEGSYLYNTNVVFDKQGYLISRYYKRNLYFEVGINVPKTNISYFDTEFGRFGSFVCFDILFGEAAEMMKQFKVTTVLFPTYWMDELPELNAMQIQAAWSHHFNVNFLASNQHFPNTGTLGSGIFNGKQGLIVGTDAADGVPRLLITKLPKNPNDGSKMSFNPKIIKGTLDNETASHLNTTYIHKNLNMKNYTVVRLIKNSGIKEVCNNGLCCKVQYETPRLGGQFYLAAFKGTLNMRNTYHLAQELCLLFECNVFENGVCKKFPTRNSIPFTRIQLSGNLTYKHVYPSVTRTGLKPVSTTLWNYDQSTRTIDYKDPKNSNSILAVVLYGRSYKDDHKPQPF